MALTGCIYLEVWFPHILRFNKNKTNKQKITNQNPNETEQDQIKTKPNTKNPQCLHKLLCSLCPVRKLVGAKTSNLTYF